MEQNTAHLSASTSEEDDSSGDDELSTSRRGRFCIERKLEPEPVSIVSNISRRPKPLNQLKPRFQQLAAAKRRKVPNYQHDNMIDTSKLNKQPPQSVIYLNPKFIKRFIEKSIKLTSSSTADSSVQTRNHVDDSNELKIAPKPIMIDEIDFSTSSKESIQAASTMAIIRIVTECIEDDSKRDERLNKVLISRLINRLNGQGETNEPNHVAMTDPTNSLPAPIMNQNIYYRQEHSGSSQHCPVETSIEEKQDDVSGGQPIPVIGGSVSHHFNNNTDGIQYLMQKQQRYSPYQRSKRMINERNNARNFDSHKNNIKNVAE